MNRPADSSASPPGTVWKFLILSLTGILLFFIPVWDGMIPVVRLIGLLQTSLGGCLEWTAIISSLLLAAELIGAKLLKIKKLSAYFGKERIRLVFWILGIAIVILKMLNVPLPFLLHPKIGGEILRLGSTVFITIAVAGSLVVFIIRSGLVDFVAVLMEPIMQPVFRLPGEAAVNIISSFVSSASVGVYFTDQYYKNGRYTTRQACSVVTSFSVVSVGYIGIVASLAGISDLYGALLISSFAAVLFMGAVMIRIPPLSLIPDTCIAGAAPRESTETTGIRQRFHRAVLAGETCARTFDPKTFGKNILQSLEFAQKIVGVMIPTVTIVLTLAYYTPLFHWLGIPFIPILRLAGVPDAAAAAPSVLIGIVEVSLPAILIGGTQAAVQTRFFVALLSIIQIIFFSEAGNAILASDIPLGFGKLVLIFFVRTAAGIPVAAYISWLVCNL